MKNECYDRTNSDKEVAQTEADQCYLTHEIPNRRAIATQDGDLRENEQHKIRGLEVETK